MTTEHNTDPGLRELIAREAYFVGEFDERYAGTTDQLNWWEEDSAERHEQYFALADRILALLAPPVETRARELIASLRFIAGDDGTVTNQERKELLEAASLLERAVPVEPRPHTICPVCETHFGYEDLGRTHEELRREWITKQRISGEPREGREQFDEGTCETCGEPIEHARCRCDRVSDPNRQYIRGHSARALQEKEGQ